MGKLAEILTGIGFFGILFFASAIDGPGNDMKLVYGGMLVSMAIMGIGALLMNKYEKEKW